MHEKHPIHRTLKVTSIATVALTLLAPAAMPAEPEPSTMVDARNDEAVALAMDLFDYAELGYLETRSSERLAGYLESSGFSVERGVAGIPTAFVANWGHGGPVIGILAEFDALPGLSQAPVPHREPVFPDGPGHACGHHLFGSASATAATAIAAWLANTGTAGTVRVYGTPAEEGGSGKVYLTGPAFSTTWTLCCTGIPPTATSPARRAPTATSPDASGFAESRPTPPHRPSGAVPPSTAWRR